MDGETTEAKRRRLDGGGDDEPSGPPAEQPPPDNGETDARPNGGTDSVAAADAPEASKRAFVSGSVSGGGAAGPETALIAQRVEATGSAGTLLFCGGTNWDTIGRRPKDKQKAAGGSASQDRNLWGPHRLAWPHRVKAVFSGCSACHTVLLTEEGQAYTWGRNDKGQLGQSDLKRRDVPTLVETLRDSLVVGAACGRGHTLFLTDHGVVFGCGDNKMGQCGVGSQNASVHVPTRVAFKLRPAVRVSCGGEFSVLVDCRGHAYTFGCPEYGQLGHNTDGRYFVTSNKLQFKCELVPRRVQVFIDRSREGHVVSVDDVHIIDVASGLNHTIALDERKRCFSWGFGGYGRLGHNEPKDEMVPRLIKAFDGPNRGLCSIHAGGTFSMAVSELGVLYFWGMNNHGGEATMYPKPIQDLTGWHVRGIGCSNKSIVVLADESVISWGPHPTYGELGYGEGRQKSSTTPQEVRLLEGIHMHAVACGLGHSVFIARDDTEEERARIRRLPEFQP
ncbi:protein RCC2 homolog isoform X1 [Amblyomma americanum]